MWEEWDDEHFVKIFFDWKIFAKYAKDNEFKELEEGIKKEISNSRSFHLNDEDVEKETNDSILLILHSFIIEKKYTDVSDYLVNIILRWNYYTSLRSEKELDSNGVKNRLKVDVKIYTLPDVYRNFEEYFYSYFPLFLIETQQLINNKKENENIKEYDVTLVNPPKEIYNFEFSMNIAYDSFVYANLFYGDLILLRFIPKRTAKSDAHNIYTPMFSSAKTDEEEVISSDSEGDKLEADSSASGSHSEGSLSGEQAKEAELPEKEQKNGHINEQENEPQNEHKNYSVKSGEKKNQPNGGTNSGKDETNDDIYMIRKYCVRHLLGYVVSKNKEQIKVKFNLNYKNFDIIDKVRKDIIYEIFVADKLAHYFVRVSKVTSLISTLRLFNCLFNFRNSALLNEIVEVDPSEDGHPRGEVDPRAEGVACKGEVKQDDSASEQGGFAALQAKKRKKGHTEGGHTAGGRTPVGHTPVGLVDQATLDQVPNGEHQEKPPGEATPGEPSNGHPNEADDLEETLKQKIRDYLMKFKWSGGKEEVAVKAEEPTFNDDTFNDDTFNDDTFNDDHGEKRSRKSKVIKNILANVKGEKPSLGQHMVFPNNDERKDNSSGGRGCSPPGAQQYRGFHYIPEALKNKFLNIYNEYQLRAINNSIMNDGITLIQGPPGTGKTTTILGIISALIFFQQGELNRSRRSPLNGNSLPPLEEGEEERGRGKKKSPYVWINYDKKNDHCYFNDNCFDAMEYEDFFDHIEKNEEEKNQNVFHVSKGNKNENNYAYAIHLSIMNASSRTLKSDDSQVDANNSAEEDVLKNNENRIKNLIGLTESFYNSYVNNDCMAKKADSLEERNANEKLNYSYYVSDANVYSFAAGTSGEGSPKGGKNELVSKNAHLIPVGEKRKWKRKNPAEETQQGTFKKEKINKLNLIKNKRILVCAPSNAAIDEILRRLISPGSGILDENGNFFNPIVTRIGRNVSTDILEFSLEFKEQLFLFLNKKEENKIIKKNLLKTSTIICSTLSASSNASLVNYIDTFDAIIIDEASQSVELDILIPLSFSCKKIILVGDPKQLSATVFSLFAKRRKYARSLFERLQRKHKMNKCKYNLLSIQYRMHPDISHFPNKYYYRNKITDAPYFLFTLFKEMKMNEYLTKLRSDPGGPHNGAIIQRDLFHKFDLFHFMQSNFGNLLPPNFHDIHLCQKNQGAIDWFIIPFLRHSVFYDISFSKQRKIKNSYINIEESEAVLQFIEFLHFIFTTENVNEWYKRIGIITPYATEKFFLKKELKMFFTKKGYKNNISNFIDIGTVDGFQGTEKDIIIFVCVRTKGSLMRKKKRKKKREKDNAAGSDTTDQEENIPNVSSASSGEDAAEDRADDEVDDSNMFFSSYKRLNVALTRAKYNLFIFGNCSFLKKCDAWGKIIKHYKMRNKIIKIRYKKFKTKMKILSEKVTEEDLFDEKVQVINKKIENSLYNKNIIDYNFVPTSENENPSFDLKSFLYSVGLSQAEEDGGGGNCEGQSEMNIGENKHRFGDPSAKADKNSEEREILSFFKQLYDDDLGMADEFDFGRDQLGGADAPAAGPLSEPQTERPTERLTKPPTELPAEPLTNCKDHPMKVSPHGGKATQMSDHTSAPANGTTSGVKKEPIELIEVINLEDDDDDGGSAERIGVSANNEDVKTQNYNQEELKQRGTSSLPSAALTKEASYGGLHTGMTKRGDETASHIEGQPGSTLPMMENNENLKNSNYFIDMLYNYCKANKELLFVVQSILPNFSRQILFKQ
ncbi:DNA2/NAM7 helicase, putative [Plasmodium vivax]|uniref:DNA2/NAM7 helicase, putative n=1 Tax=Plasmodium vivax TaxID=5855 RepID=A0A1G4HBF5_PLAVI|nr:DNA2/NAM7 helicase, putative [Plasmodium vivax]